MNNNNVLDNSRPGRQLIRQSTALSSKNRTQSSSTNVSRRADDTSTLILNNTGSVAPTISTISFSSSAATNRRSTSIGARKSEYHAVLDDWRKEDKPFREQYMCKPWKQPDPFKSPQARSSMQNLFNQPRLQTYNQQRELYAFSLAQQNPAKSNQELSLNKK
jgi:hypothetical protein